MEFLSPVEHIVLTFVMLNICMHHTPVNLQYSSCKHAFSNIAEKLWILIRWLRQKPADLDLQCFQKIINSRSALQGIKTFIDILFLYYLR